MAALALAAATLLVLPGTAAAKPHRFVKPDSFALVAELPKSHGYSVTIASFDRRHIQLLASRGHLIATYSVVGRANRNRLDADFGRFGRISLRFHGRLLKSGEALAPSCHGRSPQIRFGTLRGRIRFRGTNGFVDIDANHVHATTIHLFRQLCNRHGGDGSNVNATGVSEPHPHSRLSLRRFSPQRLLRQLGRAKSGGDEAPTLELLVAHRRTTTGRLDLAAFSVPEFLALAAVEARESVGQVQVQRSALAVIDPARLKVNMADAEPRRATLKPPKPFSGRGSYVEAPGAEPGWTGSLRVHLPGEARVPLTGPEFEVGVCRARTKQEVESCLKLIR